MDTAKSLQQRQGRGVTEVNNVKALANRPVIGRHVASKLSHKVSKPSIACSARCSVF